LLLLPEQRLLSVLKFSYQSIDITSRWWPVAQRYLGIVEGRVTALGGDPTLILPDPTGNSINGQLQCASEQQVEGRVCSLEFDRHGRFLGFSLAIKDEDCDDTHKHVPKKKFFRETSHDLAELLEKCWRDMTLVRIFFHEVSSGRHCICESQIPGISIQKVVLCEPPKHRRRDDGMETVEIKQKLIVKESEDID
jgi:hypothetical protein